MDLISFLRHRLQFPLPGIEAQQLMMPPLRRKDEPIPLNARLSAVLVMLYEVEGNWKIPLMRRSKDGKVHGGQISFPGGKMDPHDKDYTDTALRETEEEFGIDRDQVTILGNLTHLYIPPSGFVVHPRLAMLDAQPIFRPDPIEVAEIIEVELEELLEERRRGMHTIEVRGFTFETPGFTVNGGDLIWGATAMMLAELIHLVEEWDNWPGS